MSAPFDPLVPIDPAPESGAGGMPREPHRILCCAVIGGLHAPDATPEQIEAWVQWRREMHERHHAACDCVCPDVGGTTPSAYVEVGLSDPIEWPTAIDTTQGWTTVSEQTLKAPGQPDDGEPHIYWYLSFATESEFLGGLYTQAETFELAYAKAVALSANPGGQVFSFPFRARHVDPHYLDRLLTRQEVGDMPEPEGVSGEGLEHLAQPAS